MSNVFLGLVSLLLAAAPASNTAAAQAELMRIDAEFSAAAQKLGVGEAFLRYAAADAVMLPENQNAVKGRDGIRQQFAGFPAGTTLAWKPFTPTSPHREISGTRSGPSSCAASRPPKGDPRQ